MDGVWVILNHAELTVPTVSQNWLNESASVVASARYVLMRARE